MSNVDLLRNYLEKELGYTNKLRNQEIERFCNNSDILTEFSYYLNIGKFPKVMISVQGYTAKSLYEEYGKSLHTVYEAYSYLILLREKPDYALKIMHRGFPKK